MNSENLVLRNFPIDLVYLWVDGDDAQLRAKRQKYKPSQVAAKTSKQTLCAARWRNNDELRYSLRSVEQYAPWINHIYIVTDNQRPAWLNTAHEKISVIDHRDILPEDALPTFNSTAIESSIYKIPNLSEHFLFSNDDMLFSGAVSPDMFFDEEGRTIVRLKQFNRVTFVRRGNYTRMLWHMQELVDSLTGRMIPYAPHHNIDAYRKSDFEQCVSLFSEEWHRTAYSRFRQDDDMHRSFVGYWTIATGRAEMRRVGRYDRISGLGNRLRALFSNRFATDSRRIQVHRGNFDDVMRKYNPLMICMNDNERATESDCRRMSQFLHDMFPAKSDFEL